jgi:intein/homing endonuclease
MNEMDAAWLAGIIDGEGCILIRGGGGKFQGALEITNTSRKLINRLKKLGFSTYPMHWYPTKGKKGWSARVLANPMIEILRATIPHMTAKKRQAEILLSYETTKTKRIRITAKEWKYRKRCYQRLQLEKRR